jgi:hypothetical protein
VLQSVCDFAAIPNQHTDLVFVDERGKPEDQGESEADQGGEGCILRQNQSFVSEMKKGVVKTSTYDQGDSRREQQVGQDHRSLEVRRL